MATSGHMCAHIAQPVHFSGFSANAVKNPLLLKSFFIAITLAGHASSQYAHPLQRSVSIFIFPFILTLTGNPWFYSVCSVVNSFFQVHFSLPRSSAACFSEVSVEVPLSILAISSSLSLPAISRTSTVTLLSFSFFSIFR